MLKAQSVFTLEIDDVDAAVAEIKEQLDFDAMGKHAFGLIGALPAFIESGVVAALQEALPFDLIGQTSIATSTQDSDDQDQLSILVLSSDSIVFSTSLSDPITGESVKPVESAYRKAAAEHAEKPGFILTCTPLLPAASGDFYTRSLNSLSGGAPIFGAAAVDDTIDYRDAQVIYQGKGYSDRMACVLFYGEVNPRFYLASITYGKVFTETGLVTSSEGSLLKAINGAPVPEFLKDLGIKPNEEGEFIGINTYPYLVNYNDGSEPVIRIMFAVTPEGYAACGGEIPEGATLAVSYFDGGEILDSTGAVVERLAEDVSEHGAHAVLVYSCVGRYFSLGYETTAEMKLLHKALGDSGVAHAISYCGGEICPASSKGDEDMWVNRTHNSTFIAAVL